MTGTIPGVADAAGDKADKVPFLMHSYVGQGMRVNK